MMDNSSPNTGKSGTTLKANPGPQKAKNEKEVQLNRDRDLP